MLIIIVTFVLLVLFIIIESIRECSDLVLTEYSVEVPKLPRSFDGFKIMVLADLHSNMSEKKNEFVFRQIREKKPDIAIIAGDMIVCHKNQDKKNKMMAEYVKEIGKIIPVYYGNGNHETGVYRSYHGEKGVWEKYIGALDLEHNKNIHLLQNKKNEIKKDNSVITIYGLELYGKYYKRFIAKKLTVEKLESMLGKAGDNCNLLIAHHPDYFETYEQWGADVCFSGHNHGGLVRIPGLGGLISPRLHLFPKYDKGLFKIKDSIMVLSGGMGAHSIKIRIHNKPEILLVHLHCKKEWEKE